GQRRIGDAEAIDLAGFHRVFKGAERLFERRHAIELVNVVLVDPLDSEAAQRLVEVMLNLACAERRFPGRAAVRVADLGRDLRVLDECGALRAEPFAEDDLACSAAVGVRRVEPAKTDPARMIEQLKRLLLAVAGATQVRRGADPAEIATAEGNP